MPSTGFYPFLPDSISFNKQVDYCVNALNGLLSISTLPNIGWIADIERNVSMPSTGFYPFLQDSPSPKKSSKGSCQCPQRASIHFYRIIFSTAPNTCCVNALNGLLSISTVRSLRDISIILSVSMPSTGFYPFLQRLSQLLMITYSVCQCPQRASIHFYQF